MVYIIDTKRGKIEKLVTFIFALVPALWLIQEVKSGAVPDLAAPSRAASQKALVPVPMFIRRAMLQAGVSGDSADQTLTRQVDCTVQIHVRAKRAASQAVSQSKV